MMTIVAVIVGVSFVLGTLAGALLAPWKSARALRVWQLLPLALSQFAFWGFLAAVYVGACMLDAPAARFLDVVQACSLKPLEVGRGFAASLGAGLISTIAWATGLHVAGVFKGTA